MASYQLVVYRSKRDFDHETNGAEHYYTNGDIVERDYKAFVRHEYGVKMYRDGEYIREFFPN